jgi:MOSC domain-containing protein YiiM
MRGQVVSVNLAVVRSDPWAGDVGRTGIDKRPTPGRVWAGPRGLAGDQVLDLRRHGGVDQAIYAYAREDAEFWAAKLGRAIEPGNFGENLTLAGVDVTNAVIGERWQVGGAVLEVTRPRTPCRVFAGFWDVPDLIVRFTDHGVPGAYLRVITEGDIGAGDNVEIVRRPEHGVTISTVFRAITTEPELLPRLLDAPELAASDRRKVARRLAPPIA